MYVLVAGGGKIGYYLARSLLNDGHEVLIIERDKRKADAIADQPWHEYVSFEQLADAVHREHRHEPRPSAPLQQRREYAEHEAQAEAHVGNENQKPGKNADGQRELQTGNRETYGVVDREHAHHRELPSQEFGEHVVDLPGHRAHLRHPWTRQQFVDPREEQVPVAKQVEHHDWNQQQIDHDAQQHRPARLEAG